MIRTLLSIILVVYGIACILALIVAVIGIYGGGENSLAAVFAIMLAMPWAIFPGTPEGMENATGNLLMLILYMLINLAILWGVRRWMSR